ncbi:MAG TPA: hypothetical protein VGS57_13955 [Thermoanaerobaculia bacterium]|jgi:plastocyanin|nr:hypothetical protein [Thermoanaerobaculia bacterium]
MRNASAWFGCALVIVLMGCATSAPTSTSTPEATAAAASGKAALTGGCVGTTCTVVLNEAGGTCSVDPMELPISSGDTVTFVTEVSSPTAAVVITPKAASGINFQNGPPGRIDRGRRHDAGAATGSADAKYTYAARFVAAGNQNVCSPIDPVICIKGGGTGDTCETN